MQSETFEETKRYPVVQEDLSARDQARYGLGFETTYSLYYLRVMAEERNAEMSGQQLTDAERERLWQSLLVEGGKDAE